MYRSGADGTAEFVGRPSHPVSRCAQCCSTIITRPMKLLSRRRVVVEVMSCTYLAEPDANEDEARALRPLQAVAVTCRIAFGLRAACTERTRQGVMGALDRERRQNW